MKATRKIERLLKLIQALESGRSRTVDDLAEYAGVSRRTVFRDLELLARAGIRYTFDHHTRRYSADRTALLPPVTLSHVEAFTLLLATRYTVINQLAADESAATSASLKLQSLLPPAVQDYCGPLMERTEVRGDPVSDSGSIRDTMLLLQSALLTRRKVRAAYDCYYEGKVIGVVLHLYRLAYIRRGWYLIAHTEQTSSVRTYKVERILRVRLLDDHYEIDPDFTLDDYFGNAWMMVRGEKPYHVKVRFLKTVAANVDEITWHRTQRTRYLDDGSLHFEVDVDGIDEISWWILGYGDQAQVLEPPELRELIARRVRRLHAYYDGSQSQSGDRA